MYISGCVEPSHPPPPFDSQLTRSSMQVNQKELLFLVSSHIVQSAFNVIRKCSSNTYIIIIIIIITSCSSSSSSSSSSCGLHVDISSLILPNCG